MPNTSRSKGLAQCLVPNVDCILDMSEPGPANITPKSVAPKVRSH
jgi:hypothetical protein